MPQDSELSLGLDAQAYSRFSQNPLKAIQLAQGGSGDDFLVVLRQMKSDINIPGSDVYVAAIKMFLHRLAVLERSLDSDPSSLDNGIACVLGLVAAYSTVREKYARIATRVLNFIRQRRDFIADWLIRAGNLMLSNGDDIIVETATTRFGAFCAILRDVHTFLEGPTSRNDVLRGDEVFEIVTHLWIHANKAKDNDLESVLALSLSSLLEVPVFKSQGDNVLSILTRSGGSTISAMKVAVFYLRRDMRRFVAREANGEDPLLKLGYSAMQGHLLFLNMLIPGASGGRRNESGEFFNQAFTNEKGIELLIDTLTVLLKSMCKIEGVDSVVESQCLLIELIELASRAFWLLKCSLELIRTPAQMLEALEAGLINLLIRVSWLFELLNSDGQSAVRQIFLKMLIPWMDVPSSLKKMKRLPQIKIAAKTGKTMKMVRDTSLGREWGGFVQALSARHIFFRAFNAELVKCDNPECDCYEVKTEFSKCAGCHVVFYCSPECQTIAWKKYNHKAECLQTKAAFESSGFPEKSDVRYAAHLALGAFVENCKLGESKLPPPGYGILMDITEPKTCAGWVRREVVKHFKLDSSNDGPYYMTESSYGPEDASARFGTGDFVLVMKIKYSLGITTPSFLTKVVMKYVEDSDN